MLWNGVFVSSIGMGEERRGLTCSNELLKIGKKADAVVKFVLVLGEKEGSKVTS